VHDEEASQESVLLKEGLGRAIARQGGGVHTDAAFVATPRQHHVDHGFGHSYLPGARFDVQELEIPDDVAATSIACHRSDPNGNFVDQSDHHEVVRVSESFFQVGGPIISGEASRQEPPASLPIQISNGHIPQPGQGRQVSSGRLARMFHGSSDQVSCPVAGRHG
jgi:hypothetical protein